MIDKLKLLIKEYDSLTQKMSNPEILSNIKQYAKLAKEHRRLSPIINKSQSFIKPSPFIIKIYSCLFSLEISPFLTIFLMSFYS